MDKEEFRQYQSEQNATKSPRCPEYDFRKKKDRFERRQYIEVLELASIQPFNIIL